jgi:hypothetical protein
MRHAVSMRVAPLGLIALAACGRVHFGYPLVECEDVVADATLLFSDNDHCYTRHDLSLDGVGTAAACASIGGHTATITSAEENEVIRGGLSITTATRIGLTTGGIGSTTWGWSTGEAAPYSDWAAGEPAICSVSGSAGRIGPAGWTSACGGDGMPFTCEIEPWLVRDDGHAYRVSWGANGWAVASAACEAVGAHLVVLDSFEELMFVAPIATRDMWIGLSGSAGSYAWVTGEPLGFGIWSSPSPDAASLECVMMHSGSLDWSDIGCSAGLPALCEREP